MKKIFLFSLSFLLLVGCQTTNDYPINQMYPDGYKKAESMPKKIRHQGRKNYSAVEAVESDQILEVEEERMENQAEDVEICVGVWCSCVSE